LQAQGEFALIEQKLKPALELSGQPVKRGTMAHEHVMYMIMVDSAGLVRDEAAIRRYAPVLEELARRDDHRRYLAIAHRAWGIAHRLAGEYDAAETCLVQALEVFAELESRWQLGRSLLELGELEQARSNPAAARDYCSKALAAFEAVQAMPDAARTQAMLRSLGG
jgi:tetratricopeptide (TPR) repeat protein